MQYASAHEGRPVFIQLKASINPQKQVAPRIDYELRWKIPPVIAKKHLPEISLYAENCEVLHRSEPILLVQTLVGKRNYQCIEELKNLRIDIIYPESNPALSSLIIAYDVDGNSRSVFSGPQEQTIYISKKQSAFEIASQYIEGGVKHIAFGFDHLFFVLCLMIIAASISRILITVTGFTIGHTVTLLLSSFNLISVPILFVEMLIALSIVVLAAEILRTETHNRKLSLTWRYPVIVASSFGLLHGLGFASTLSQLGLPQNHKVTAILFFNLGIEIGQFVFIAIILFIMFLLNRLIQSKQGLQIITKTAVFSIGVLASYWLFDRLI